MEFEILEDHNIQKLPTFQKVWLWELNICGFPEIVKMCCNSLVFDYNNNSLTFKFTETQKGEILLYLNSIRNKSVDLEIKFYSQCGEYTYSWIATCDNLTIDPIELSYKASKYLKYTVSFDVLHLSLITSKL